jgi:hypothetical protein
MELPSLNRLLAAVCAAVPGRRLVLFGSSSLLGSFPGDPSERIGVAVTIDADFFLDPDDESQRRRLDEEFGEDNAFHLSTGHYGDFVDLRLADSFPDGWRDRLVPMPGFENVLALDPVDMAVTKVATTARARLNLRLGRGGVDRGLKDINTIVALLRPQRRWTMRRSWQGCAAWTTSRRSSSSARV